MSHCIKDGVLAIQFNRSIAKDSKEFAAFYDVMKITPSDIIPGFNSNIVKKVVQSIVNEYFGPSTIHGGLVEPKLATYNDILKLVLPGNPEASELWDRITTNDLNKAIPPVNKTDEILPVDKSVIYNWIKIGAKEQPVLENFRPVAIGTIVSGCASGN